MGGLRKFRISKGLILFFLIIYLFVRDTERGRDQREKQAPCRKPDVGLDPGTPGSRLGPKAGAKPLSHPRIPAHGYLIPTLTMDYTETMSSTFVTY